MAEPKIKLPDNVGLNIYRITKTVEGVPSFIGHMTQDGEKVDKVITGESSDEVRQNTLDHANFLFENKDNVIDTFAFVKGMSENRISDFLNKLLHGDYGSEKSDILIKKVNEYQKEDKRAIPRFWVHFPPHKKEDGTEVEGQRKRATASERDALYKEGWKEGRDWDLEEKAQARTDEAERQTQEGKHWYFKIDEKGTNTRVRLLPEDIPGYITQGFRMGKGPGKARAKKEEGNKESGAEGKTDEGKKNTVSSVVVLDPYAKKPEAVKTEGDTEPNVSDEVKNLQNTEEGTSDQKDTTEDSESAVKETPVEEEAPQPEHA